MKHAYGAPSYELEDIQRANDEAKVQGSDDPFMPFVAPEGKVSMFQHEHLSNASFNIFSKLEIKPIKRMGDLHRTILQRIILLVLQSRMQARYAETNADYKRVELDHSDSAREGCCVSTVTVTCEPREYEFALQVAVEEARRLQLHGLTPSELDRFKAAMIRDSSSSRSKRVRSERGKFGFCDGTRRVRSRRDGPSQGSRGAGAHVRLHHARGVQRGVR